MRNLQQQLLHGSLADMPRLNRQQRLLQSPNVICLTLHTHLPNSDTSSLRCVEQASLTMSIGRPVKDMRRVSPTTLRLGMGRSAIGASLSPLRLTPAMADARVLMGAAPLSAVVFLVAVSAMAPDLDHQAAAAAGSAVQAAGNSRDGENSLETLWISPRRVVRV